MSRSQSCRCWSCTLLQREACCRPDVRPVEAVTTRSCAVCLQASTEAASRAAETREAARWTVTFFASTTKASSTCEEANPIAFAEATVPVAAMAHAEAMALAEAMAHAEATVPVEAMARAAAMARAGVTVLAAATVLAGVTEGMADTEEMAAPEETVALEEAPALVEMAAPE